MSIYNYTLPSGATFQLNAPAGTTQAEADKIFYSQVAAGTFVGYNKGDTLTHPQEALINFGLSRLQRGTAGVDTKTLTAIISGLPIVVSLPSLTNVSVANTITQADYVQVVSNPDEGTYSQGPAAIGTGGNALLAPQIQALMAQLAAIVNQGSNIITQAKGVGTYGFNAQQLERAGYIKPGYAQSYCAINASTLANPTNFVSFMQSPSPWTGLNGINSVNDILSNPPIQNQIQEYLMNQSYDAFVAAGLIIPSKAKVSTPSISTGYVYNSTGNLEATSALNLLNSKVGAS